MSFYRRHTVSELGHTGDVLACVEAVCGVIEDMAHALEEMERDFAV